MTISIPRYTRAESTLIRRQGRWSARAKARSVLPAAVGPIKNTASGLSGERIMPALSRRKRTSDTRDQSSAHQKVTDTPVSKHTLQCVTHDHADQLVISLV